MITEKEFLNYLTEETDFQLSSKQDKNPLYYAFVALKLKGGKRKDQVENDYDLKGVFAAVDTLCKKLGKANLKILSNNFKPLNVNLRIEGHRDMGKACKILMKDLEECVLSNCISFSETYKIQNAFKDFLSSKEVEDYLNSLKS